MIQHSETLGSLATALAKAQAELDNVTKDAKNPHFKSEYATLAAITDTVRPVLAKHGLAVMQLPGFADGVVTVDTLLTHSSGEWVRGRSAAPVAKADPQGVGSACTYLRRYSLAALCGIAQADDDGNSASHAPQHQSRPQASGSGKATAKQVEYLGKMMASSVFTDEERERVQSKVADGAFDTVRKAIEWAKAELAARKEAA